MTFTHSPTKRPGGGDTDTEYVVINFSQILDTTEIHRLNIIHVSDTLLTCVLYTLVMITFLAKQCYFIFGNCPLSKEEGTTSVVWRFNFI